MHGDFISEFESDLNTLLYPFRIHWDQAINAHRMDYFTNQGNQFWYTNSKNENVSPLLY